MKARPLCLWAALVLLVLVSGAWAQSRNVASAQTKGIDPALLARAQAGDHNAEFDIGYDYETGEGVPQDCSKAAFWFRKAAEQGDSGAQYNLALLYNTGNGVPLDYAEGYFWAELAATGKVEGIKPEVLAQLRDQTASFLTKEVLLQTQKRAREWFAAHQSEAATPNGSSSRPPKDTDTSPASSSAQNAAPQEWVKDETDQIRAIVQAIRQCPAHVSTDASSTISDGPPYNVTWDVTASQSVRAPYSGYIEFAVLRRVSCNQQPNQKQRLSDSCLRLMNLLVKPPLILRYEYDLSPDELSLSKILVRFDNETEWSNRSNVSNYCWERAAQPIQTAR